MKIVTWLMLLWLFLLTVTTCFLIKAEKEFLKFADFVIDDNLKNVVQSGKNTYYVVDMASVTPLRPDNSVKFWSPVYIDSKDMDKLLEWMRKNSVMVKEYEEMKIAGSTLSSSADSYIKRITKDALDRRGEKK